MKFKVDKVWEGRKAYFIRNRISSPYKRLVSALPINFKYAGFVASIPENLDIDKHLEAFPILNYYLVDDGSGHIKSINKNGKLGLFFDKERLIHLIDLISTIPLSNDKSIDEKGFVSINSTILQNYFDDYLSYLDYLIRTGVLVSNNQYFVGSKSKGYKFAPEYENMPLVRYEYSYFQSNAIEIAPVPEKIFSSVSNHFIVNPLLGFPYLNHWYNEKKISIDKLQLIPIKITDNIRVFSQNKLHKKDGLNEDAISKIQSYSSTLETSQTNLRLKAILALLIFQGMRQIEITRLNINIQTSQYLKRATCCIT